MATISGASWNGGSFTVSSGDVFTNGTISGSTVNVYGEILSSVILNVDVIEVDAQGSVSASTFGGGEISVDSGGLIHGITMSAARTFGQINVLSGGSGVDLSATGWDAINLNGGSVNTVKLYNGAGLRVNSGGSASNVDVGYGGILNVNSGGSVNIATAEISGGVAVLGGTISSLNISGGSATVFSGGQAINTLVQNGGHLTISAGGITSNTNLSSTGTQTLLSGGSALGTTASSGSLFYVSGAASNTSLLGGYEEIESGGTETGATILSGGNMEVMQGGTASSISVQGSGSWLEAHSGGTIRTATVGSSAAYGVDVGATASNVTIASGGSGYVNGSSFSGAVQAAGTLYVGGTATSTTVLGSEIVTSGGADQAATILSGGRVTVQSAAEATSAVVNDGGKIDFQSGSIGSGISVLAASNVAVIIVESGATVYGDYLSGAPAVEQVYGKASNTTLLSAGQDVQAGGTVYNTTATGSHGNITLETGAVAISGTVANGARLDVRTGATASNVTIASGGSGSVVGSSVSGVVQASGTLYVTGTATATAVQGSEIVTNGGVESGALLQSSGTVTVFSGGIISGATVKNGANIYLSGGNSYSGSLSSGGWEYVNSGSVASGTIVSAGAFQNITANGLSVSAVFLNSGNGSVQNGGVLANANVDGGWVEVNGGGTVSGGSVNTGEILVSSGAFVTGTNIKSAGYIDLYGSASGITLDSVASSVASAAMSVENTGVATSVTVGSNSIVGIYNGGTANGALVEAGGILKNGGNNQRGNNQLGGTVSGATLYGTEYISSGGIDHASTIESGGNITVYSQGMASGVIVSGGGKIDLQSGSIGSSISVLAASAIAVIKVESGATVNGDYLSGAPAVEQVYGTASNTTLVSAGQDVQAGGTVYNTTATGSQGNITLETGAVAISGTVASGARIDVRAGATASASTISNGGSLNVANGGNLAGITMLENGGKATIWNNAGGTIVMDGSTNTGLVVSGLSDGGTLSTVISGFNGASAGNSDGITLAGLKPSSVQSVSSDGNTVTMTLTDGKTIVLNIPGIGQQRSLQVDSNGDVIFEVCFLAGSMIRTPSGDVAVEELRIGDSVMTWDWKAQAAAERPVVWAGRKSMQVKAGRAEDEAGYPVRILKDALADGVPSQDLLVTPEHCLFFEDKFVPVRMLVNGRSIFYDRSITSYDYFHIETEEHAVIWANDTRTESYLDTGNRAVFSQDGSLVRLVPQGEPKSWETDGAARLTVERATVEPLFAQFSARAVAAGMDMQKHSETLTENPDIHLVTGAGQIIRPARHKNDLITFMLPSGLETVRIVSRASRPSDVIGPFVDDRRQLGVLVGQITLFDGNTHHKITEHLEQAELSGWNAKETAHCRWTNGNAILQLPERKTASLSMLTVQVVAAGPYLVHQDGETENSLKIAN